MLTTAEIAAAIAAERCEYEEAPTREAHIASATSPYSESCWIRRDTLTDGSFVYGVDFTCGPVRLRFDCMDEGHAINLADELEPSVSSVDVLAGA